MTLLQGIRRASLERVTPRGEYLGLGSDEPQRQAAYRALFAAGLDHELLREIRSSTHGGYAIGNARFWAQLEHALQQRATPRGPGQAARREDR